MDKLSTLLNENTIVDFKLLWKLSLRYRSHLIVALLFCYGLFSYTYYSQPVIYAVNVPIKAVANHTVAKDLTALVPTDNTSSVNLDELKISLDTYSFFKSYAELALQDPKFDKLNFGSINSRKSLFGYELKKSCGLDKDCLMERLTNSLKGSFYIEQGLTDNRFKLTVNAIEKLTVLRLTAIIIKAIDLNRVHVRQYLVIKELQSVNNLIVESRSLMQKMDGYKALEEQEKLNNNIFELKEKLKYLQYSASTELANTTALESRLTENKRFTKSRSISSLGELEKIKKSQARLLEIKQNIATLTSIDEEKLTTSDRLIITQLSDEQARLSKILPPEPHRKSMELAENFIEGQRGKSGDFEFDYQVSKNKLEKLQQDYETAKAEMNQMLQQKLTNENKVMGMKADLEFLKNLEAKQMSLKLLNATMTTDLIFEDNSSVAKEFRQATFLRVILFSLSITLLLYMISIVIRYMSDDRIYGEEEIRSHLKNLDFVGEVPTFE
ncbi:MAG: hypothetical protein WC635_04955 [Bacteriovorax sp.]|jgi:hypothetical protein